MESQAGESEPAIHPGGSKIRAKRNARVIAHGSEVILLQCNMTRPADEPCREVLWIKLCRTLKKTKRIAILVLARKLTANQVKIASRLQGNCLDFATQLVSLCHIPAMFCQPCALLTYGSRNPLSSIPRGQFIPLSRACAQNPSFC